MSSDLYGKLETDVEIKASSSQFHHMFTHKPHHISNASSDKVQACNLHEGDWGTVGAVISWNYFHDGKPRVAKQIIEAIDEKKNSITFRMLEGDLMEHFTSFVITIQGNPKIGGKGSIIHWHLEYEKKHGEIVDPHTLVEFFVELSKDLETHLLEDDVFGKLETDVEIKASPSKFHHMFKHKPHHISNVSSDKIQGCDLHEGEWGTVGAVLYWNYFHDGKPCVAKEIVEAVDDEKNSITFRVIEGDLMEHFNSFVVTIQANPKVGGEGSIVHWTLEYEKKHGEIVDPHTLLEFVADVSKDLETHLLEED
ncbi:MLP-like protein 28 [Morus notabilis]|uniref:MLP-like protein 28 n=1 Tax=Morus notabilis TaxID=981085 RepID=W9QSL3_9ROSA|nr:MLP-like protein 28 [Morus notabilis]EXB52998.1 MLP-like protein 28 [Morus notabilis]